MPAGVSKSLTSSAPRRAARCNRPSGQNRHHRGTLDRGIHIGRHRTLTQDIEFGIAQGIAEAWLQRDNWALFREMLRGNGNVDRYISDLSRPDALKASLNWYRANLAPRLPESPPKLPPVEAPTLGIWSLNDHYLDSERMKMSGQFVKGRWRYEQIDDASHWIPLDAPDRLNQLLIEWLGCSEKGLAS